MSAVRLTAALALATIVLSSLQGCGGDSGGDVATADLASAEGVVSTLLEGTLELEVSGAVEASWSGATPIRVVTVVGGGAPENSWFLSVGLEEPVETGEWKVRPAFDLVPYSGNGTYDVTPDGKAIHRDPEKDVTKGGELTVPLKGGAFLVAAEGVGEPVNFNEVRQPCVFEIRERGLEGSVECADVGGGPAGTISFRWSWTADQDRVLDRDNGDSALPPGPADTPDDGPAAGAEPGGAPSEGTETQPGDETGMPLEVDVAPQCVEKGDVVRVSVRTEPGSSIALALAYSDAQPHGGTSVGTSDGAGNYSASFSVPADAPFGEASALVSAGSSDGKRSSSSIEKFSVEESC